VDEFSYPKRFAEITGVDGHEMLEARPAKRDTDRGIMMLAFRCMANGVLMTEQEQARFRAAIFRLGNIHD